MARALWLVVVACAWWCAEGTVLRSVQGVLERAALQSGTPVSCSTITISKNNAAPYTVNHYDLWQSSECSWNNGGGTINLAGPTSAWGPTLQTSFNVAGCFDVGDVFNIWVNANAATHAYMAPYAVTIDPSASWCNFNFGGAVDTISTSFSTGAALPVVPVNMLCVFKPGAYVVNSYQLWASPTCQYNFGEGNDCTAMVNLPSCFTNGTPFNLWVNAAAATQAAMAQYAFVVNYDSTWAAVYAGGTVDAITFSITQASDFPAVPVSGIAVCNQGWYLVNSYNLYYSVACDYQFNTTVNNADLASLAQTNSACFGAGTSFALALAPTAGTSTFIAPYNFNYDPNALPYVVIASGTVDDAKWGLISPATVSSSQDYICEPQQYPQSALSVSGSNVDLTSDFMPAGIPNWYPQCNNTAAINTLTSLTDMEPNPTVCNAALIAWLIENLAAAIPIGE